MKREILVSTDPREIRLALLEDGQVMAVKVEREASKVGSIYKGMVEAVLPGMDSAFVDVGNVFNGTNNFDTGELRASAGVALLWRAPVGPISISYAYPFKKKDGDEIERLQFTFGGGF